MDTKRYTLAPFDATVDSQNLRREWEEWHRAFELEMEVQRVFAQHEKLIMMLSYGGRGLQRIFYNLKPVPEEIIPEVVPVPMMPPEDPEYDNAIKRLDRFFVGKVNDRVELELFRSLRQGPDESFKQFLLRLRTQAARCEFNEREDKEILQQISMAARDEKVRDKGLENVMDLDALTNYANNREILVKQKEKAKPYATEEVLATSKQREGSAGPSRYRDEWSAGPSRYRDGWNAGPSRPRAERSEGPSRSRDRRPASSSRSRYGSMPGGQPRISCDRCGSWNHDSNSNSCSARGLRCHQCGKVGHYARQCPRRGINQWRRSGNEVNSVDEAESWKEEVPRRPKAEDIAKVDDPDSSGNDGHIFCMIGSHPVQFLIDSGSSINTITEEVWNKLTDAKVKMYNVKTHCSRSFTAYASRESLSVLTMFEAHISVNPWKPQTYAEFFVIKGAAKCLLSKRTSEELHVLKVGIGVDNIDVKMEPFPKFPNVQVKLSIDKSVPPRLISYLRVPVALEAKVDAKIMEMLQTDIIEKVEGPPEWISPMVVIPKGSGDVRICINMKYPNEAIQREHYPLPVIDTFLNKLRGAKYFSRLDITSAFYHVELHPESRAITTFMTARGLMRFKRLMFGITCAPEIYQRIMTEMLTGIEGVIIYIDDIVVAGRTLEEHDERLREVLAVLERNNTLLNRSKCVFRVSELEILGFKVSAHGISPSEEKVQAIKNFRKPETKEEVRSFLGLMNFVGHFIPHLSTRSEPLRKFLRGEVETFGIEQTQAFDDLRNELSNHVRKLGFFDPKETTELYVDASPVGLGAVLVQRDSNNTPRIVSFASKGLTASERIYPQTQREALAVVWAVEKFFFYLFGLHFTLYTDHKTLEYIYGGRHQIGKRACSRAEGWALRLQPYDFGVKYLPGTDNISDTLSRLITQEDPAFDDNAEHYLLAVGEEPSALTLDEIKRETSNDETLSAVVKALETDEWSPELFRYQAFDKELGVVDGILVRGERIVLPVKLRARALEIAHRGHPGVVSMRRNLRERVWWPCMDRDVKDNIQGCHGCAVVSKQNPPEPMQRKQMPERAWQEIAIDFFTAKECATFLVVIDYYSRFLKVIEMKTTTAAKTIEALESVFEEQTYPEVIRSDNGPPFASEEFRNYCLKKNVRLVHTIPYWPQMNGLVEKSNQGILRTLRIAKVSGTNWRKALEEYVHVYNRTPHSVTEKAPLELLLGRPVKDLLPSLRTEPGLHRDEGVRDMDAMKKAKGKLYADEHRHAKPSDIKIGDTVMLKNYDSGKLEPNFRSERFTVIQRSGNDVVVESEDGVEYRRCVTHLKKWPIATSSDNRFPEADPIEGDKNPEPSDPEEEPAKRSKHLSDDQAEGTVSTRNRPTRTRKLPARYNS